MATVEQPPAAPAEDKIPDVIEEKRKDADGKIVTAKYLKGKLLGKGGFAKCYLGLLLPAKTPYALKIVAKNTLTKTRARQKFQAEIRIHRTLRHSNIVKFERYFEDLDNAYILMELCTNNSMSDMLKRRKKLTEPEVRFYLYQLVDSLQYLHSILVIHRDLKLGNLFLDAQMRIKVGDFGLATRLNHIDERRKTICGTPNYIAPEILEGKDGHSFEVDIWSTGVIMYTLLIGKPPFESKDVKSTYKRIATNSYSFPDHTFVCERAKNLIRHMLQARPENRPKLDQILEHPFFTHAAAYMPASLPESALRDAPPAHPTSFDSNKMLGQPAGSNPTTFRSGDENDPMMINRQSRPAGLQSRADVALPLKQAGGVPAQMQSGSAVVSSRPKSAPHGTLVSDRNPIVVPGTSAAVQSSQQPLKSDGQSSKRAPLGTLSNRPSNQGNMVTASTTSAGVAKPTSSGTAFGFIRSGNPSEDQQQHCIAPAPRLGSGQVQPSRSQSQARPSTSTESHLTQQGSDAIASSRKFSAFDDMKSSAAAVQHSVGTQAHVMASKSGSAMQSATGSNAAIHSATSSGVDRRSASASTKRDVVPARSNQRREEEHVYLQGSAYPRASSAMLSRPVSSANGTANVAVAGLQSDVEQMNLVEEPYVHRRDAGQLPGRAVQEAWAWHEDGDAFQTNGGGSKSMYSNSTSGHAAGAGAAVNSKAAVKTPHSHGSSATAEPMRVAGGEHHDMHLATPPDQVILSKKDGLALDTLETMHQMLTETCGGLNDNSMLDEAPHRQPSIASIATSRMHTTSTRLQLMLQAANVWVVRYVDYTSKYGLGFLLNTGSAGVYFNDSTKIVLSADGKVFQYIERKRRDNIITSGSEHTIQTHLLSCYPPELHKKVTLLCHFRNYLVDQHKSGANGGDDDGENMEASNKIPAAAVDSNASGASHAVKFGISSARYIASEDRAGVIAGGGGGSAGTKMMCTSDDDCNHSGDEEHEMPFLKKWVRTKHAILFRLSNRTVQVVFFDRSEVLLSSEARIVTYVNKQGERSEHSLEEVLQTGRKDIAKRLKYTKDIMHKLINIQAR